MKIATLKIENFMAVGAAQLVMADRGLVLIQGENNDETSAESNGAGKSSIPDALCWCLFGTTARGEEGDKVVNRTAGKGTMVQVRVEDGPRTYVITRFRKHKTGKNRLAVDLEDGPNVTDLSKGTDKLTQPVVDQIIGCSYEVFRGAIYAGQEQMPDLPGMTDKALKMLIEEAAGATVLEAAYKEANSRLNTAKAGLEVHEAARKRSQSLLEVEELQATELEAKAGAFETNRASRVTAHQANARSYVERATRCKTALAGTTSKADVLTAIAACESAIGAVESERAEERRLAAQLTTAQLETARIVREHENLADDLRRRKAAHDALDHQVGCPCGSCNRPFTEADIAPAKKIAYDEMRELATKLAAVRAQREAALSAQQERTDALDAFRASMTSVSEKQDERANLQVVLAEIEKVEREQAEWARKARDEVERMKEVKAEANPFTALIQTAKEKVAARQKEIADQALALSTAEVGVKEAELVAKVFSPAGVRAYLLDEVTPFLNTQTATYLGTLSDGNITATWTTLVKDSKGDLREKFAIEVTTATGGETFKGISGGEKRKVRIACALALQDLVARRASKPIELFIGDEIDDALDAAGLERLTMILEEKARERGSVFIISHNDLKDWVSNTITVKKVGGKATIEETVS